MQIRAIFALPSLVPPSLGALGSCPSRPPLDPPLIAPVCLYVCLWVRLTTASVQCLRRL